MKMQVVWARTMLAMLLLAVSACGAETDSKGKFQASLDLNDDASAADVGLPAYPGSKPFKEADDSSSGANVGLSTSLFGFKVVALKLQSADKPERVAAFYRDALSKYGAVLECRDDAAIRADTSRSDDALTCDSNDYGKHTVVYKVGTKQNQRLVAIKPLGDGSQFNLVHIDVRDDAKH